MNLKTFFIVLIVLALCVVGVGFYQGWWVMSTHREGDSNKVDVNLKVDPDKAKADAEALKAKAAGLTGKSVEKTPVKTPDDNVKTKDK